MKEKKTYNDGMADTYELALKVMDQMSDAYDVLQQVSEIQSGMGQAQSKDYSEQIAMITILQSRLESQYCEALDARKIELQKERELQFDQ